VVVEDGPIPAVHGVVRWRIIDLCQWLWDEFEVAVSKQTLGRELRAMGYRKLSARPRHHAGAKARSRLLKNLSACLDAIGRAKRVWQASDAMTSQAAVQRGARQMRDGGLQRVEAVVEREERVPAKRNNDGLIGDAQAR
jgi:hypothetical protein